MKLQKGISLLLALAVVSMLGLAQQAQAQEEKKEKDTLKVGGALRYNIRYTDYGAPYPESDNFKFDTFRLDVDAQKGGIIFDAQYRWYGTFGEHLHHGWIGFKPTETSQVEMGVTQVPFGNLTYASHNWYFVTPYYVGLEDDYDAGIKYTDKFGNLSLAVAYFMEPEPGIMGTESRYSYDITENSGDGYSISEREQGNIRVAYTVAGTEIGVSGQYGGLYNSTLDEWGSAMAGSFHVNGNYGPMNLKLQYTYYNYDAKKDDGTDAKKINMSAYNANYFVAAEAQMFTVGASYKVKIGGLVDSLTFYDDYTYTMKSESSFDDTQQNTVGFVIAAGGVWTYVDFTTAKNQPWINGGWTNGLAGGGDNEWHNNFNINLAYYF